MTEWLARWETAEAECALLGTTHVDLPGVAAEALTAGWDTPSLRELAGTVGADDRETRELFTQALDELGRSLPTEPEASARLVRRWSRAIVDGTVAPHMGARGIAGLGPDHDDYSTFAMLEDEWVGRWAGRSRDEIDREIVAEARAVLERPA